MNKACMSFFCTILILVLTGSVAAAESGNTARLTLISGGNSAGEFEIELDGELNAEILLRGLTDLTGCNFALESATYAEGAVFLAWADNASFLPGGDGGANVNAELNLTFPEPDSLMEFMLDSAYATIRGNLGEVDVYFSLADGTDIDFCDSMLWSLPSWAPYSGTFEDYRLHETDGYTFINQLGCLLDEDTRDFAYSAADYIASTCASGEGDSTSQGNGWYILLTSFEMVDGKDAYRYSVCQGSEDSYSEVYACAVTLSGDLYLFDKDSDEYVYKSSMEAY